MTNSEAIYFLKKVRTSYRAIKRTDEGSEDCAHWVIIKILEGKYKHATFHQMVINYLRVENGRKNTARHSAKHVPLKRGQR